MEYSKEEVSKIIDHTFLKPDGSLDDITQLCEEAKKYSFASVAIAPDFVQYAARELQETEIKIDVAIGFPLGYTTTRTKIFETREAIINGATEVDMVVNISAVKDQKWNKVKEEIKSVAEITGDYIFKVIFETCYLDNKEIKKLGEICLKINGVDYIKTSTGFGPAGATVPHVQLMNEIAGDSLKVKAAGGIRTFKDLQKMINAGADRIGTSSGVAIMNEIE
ncbi:MAG: deoxyribose-phosphate aldolase [Halanaerobiaceae bacterium]